MFTQITHPGQIVIAAGLFILFVSTTGALLVSLGNVLVFAGRRILGKEALLQVRTVGVKLMTMLMILGGAISFLGLAWTIVSSL